LVRLITIPNKHVVLQMYEAMGRLDHGTRYSLGRNHCSNDLVCSACPQFFVWLCSLSLQELPRLIQKAVSRHSVHKRGPLTMILKPSISSSATHLNGFSQSTNHTPGPSASADSTLHSLPATGGNTYTLAKPVRNAYIQFYPNPSRRP
jgi:hypothetical protein